MLELTNFFEFIKKPNYNAFERKETNVLKTAFKVFLISYVVLTLVNGMINSILGLFFTLPEDRLEELFQSMKISSWGIFVIIAFMAPAMEEVLFRYPLVFRIKYIPIIFSILIGVVIHYIIPYLPELIVILLLYFVFSFIVPKHEKKIFDLWVRYFRFVVWFSAILFGLVHIGNFEIIKGFQYLIVPFLIIPQLGIGFVLAYVRLTYKKGFLIGLLVHIFINALSSSIFLFYTSTNQ